MTNETKKGAPIGAPFRFYCLTIRVLLPSFPVSSAPLWCMLLLYYLPFVKSMRCPTTAFVPLAMNFMSENERMEDR
mgnify:CR=1 FL=1